MERFVSTLGATTSARHSRVSRWHCDRRSSMASGMSSSATSGSQRSTVASSCPIQRSAADQRSTGLWKLTSCGKLLRTFPQDLENASRFPHLPQPLPATRKERRRNKRRPQPPTIPAAPGHCRGSKLPTNRCPPCLRPPVHHVAGPNRPAGGLPVVFSCCRNESNLLRPQPCIGSRRAAPPAAPASLPLASLSQ